MGVGVSRDEAIEYFAKKCGCVIVDCGSGWGGRIGYQHSDDPHCTCAGYRTRMSAYKAFLRDTFGDRPMKAIVKLLERAGKAGLLQ